MLWMNATPFFFIGVIFSALSVSVSQDPCLDGNAMMLDHMTKRSTSYVMDSSSPLCDRYITETWYRPIGYVMATSPPSLTFCGTLYPVWMSEPFPPDGVNETLIACEVGFNNTCERRHMVDVKNCTDFLVYKLKALDVCNSAYCFELQNDCVNQTVTNVKVSFNKITWTKSEQNGIIRYDPSINLLCSFTHSADDTLLYHIDWYVDNDIVIQGQTVDKDSLQDAILSAEDMNIAGKKINSWIHCVVGIKRINQKYPCLSKPSNIFFAGIEILNRTLTMERKGRSRLIIRPTIPFASETIETRDGTQVTSPLNIQLSFPADAKCQQQSSGNLQECSITIDSFTHNDRQLYENPTNWNKTYPIDVFNTDDEKYEKSDHKLVLRLETNAASGTGAQIFAKATFHDVFINVVDNQEAWKGKHCSSHGDPYITTFDGCWYTCQQIGCAAGQTYILYRNEEYLQEVQVKHEDCDEGSCLCALVVRAGHDVFMIDTCNKREFINFLVCKEDSLKVIKVTVKHYEIFFPTGTIVKASIRLSRYNESRIFTDVYPSVSDIAQTSGLCGYLDSNITNDLRWRSGYEDNITMFNWNRNNPPDGFALSWRISVRSLENLLSYSWDVYDNLASLSSAFHKLCTCAEKQTRCSYKTYKECRTETKGKEYHCRLHSSQRKKRDLYHLTNFRRSTWESQKKVRSRRQTYTESDAFDICNEIFQSSGYYMTCFQVVPNFNNETLVNCLNDLMLSGSPDIAQWHLDSALEQCQTYVQLNSSFQSEHINVSINILNLCQNNCSQKGVCFKGNCTCDHGYGGSDCSFDVSYPPTITRLSGDGVCDTSEETCEDITLYGHYFVENMRTTCFITREEINERNFVMSTTSYNVRLEENTLYEGYCSLQYGPKTSWITMFHFNLSNDATQVSETYRVYVYQSECQTFHNNSGIISFTLQSGYCFIQGTCIQSGMIRNNQSCWRCSPQMAVYNWTWVSECDIANTTDSSVVRITESSVTQSAVTETYENTVKQDSAEEQLDLDTIGLYVAVAVIAVISLVVVGIVITIRNKGHQSKSLNIYSNGPYAVSNKHEDIACIPTKGNFHSAE